jgi:hypothetical protein
MKCLVGSMPGAKETPVQEFGRSTVQIVTPQEKNPNE